MPKRYQATSTNVEDYWQLFVNRRAYVLQSMRPHAESGRYYYFRPKAGKNGEAPSLAEYEVLERTHRLTMLAQRPWLLERRYDRRIAS